MADEAAVRAAIAGVLDPCSRLQGTDLSLLDLGMVERITVSGAVVRVDLLLDDPLCVYTFVIQQQLREGILALDGVDAVEVTVLPSFEWTRERVSPAAEARLLDDGLLRRLVVVPAAR